MLLWTCIFTGLSAIATAVYCYFTIRIFRSMQASTKNPILFEVYRLQFGIRAKRGQLLQKHRSNSLDTVADHDLIDEVGAVYNLTAVILAHDENARKFFCEDQRPIIPAIWEATGAYRNQRKQAEGIEIWTTLESLVNACNK